MKKLTGCLSIAAITMSLIYALATESQARPREGGEAVDVPAGPIWNHEDAKVKCPAVCTAAGGRWNGNWKTVIPGSSSVCGCD